MTRRLIFGDDQSQSADLAWMWINSQSWQDWTIEVLSAHPDAGKGDATPVPWQPEHPRELLDPTATNPIEHLQAHADPRVALSECGDRDLMVVGPRGRGLFKALHLGSTADWLLHDPPAPLVVVRRGTPVRRVVVCADGSPDSMAAAEVLAGLPWISGVHVIVASVDEPGLAAAQVAERTADVLRGHAGSVETQVTGPTEMEVFYHVRDVLLEVVRRSDADLVVHGTRGLSGLSGLRAGSIATSLAGHAPCSVLVTHQRTG